MSARARIHAMFTLDEAAETELDVRLDAHAAEVLAEIVDPTAAATIYAVRECVCEETPHPTWCPASVPTDARIAEIRQGIGAPLIARELSWLSGTAARHEAHVIGARGLHWPLTDDLPGALLLVSQYLAAAMAVIDRAGVVDGEATDTTPLLVDRFDLAMEHAPEEEPGLTVGAIAEDGRPIALCFDPEDRAKVARWLAPELEEATAAVATATPFFQPGHVYTREHHGQPIEFHVDCVTTPPDSSWRIAFGWRLDEDGDWEPTDADDLDGWTDITGQVTS